MQSRDHGFGCRITEVITMSYEKCRQIKYNRCIKEYIRSYNTVRQVLLIIMLLILTGNRGFCVDWAKVEADYKVSRARLEKKGPPAYYVTQANSKALVFDSRPEFGIGVHIFDQSVADNLKRANIRFIRQTMYWYLIENTTEPGKYDQVALEKWDKLVELYKKNNIIPLIIVHGNAPGCSFANRTESYKRFARFMAFVAKRYPSIRYWELWNEMDVAFTDLFGANVQPSIPLEQRGRYYAQMLKIVYPVINKANPKSIVVTGGMTDFGDFPKGIYEAGGKDYFDIMNLHTYGIPLQWSFVQRGEALRGIMKTYGDSTKPLWNTEFGLDAGSVVAAWGMPKPEDDAGAVFDNHQKDMISSCLEFNRKSGLYQKCFAYQYFAVNEAMSEQIKNTHLKFPAGMELDDYGFGFTRRDGVTPRPIFQYLIDTKVNDKKQLAVAVKRKVTLNGQSTSVKLNSDYPTEIVFQSKAEQTPKLERMEIRNHQLVKGSNGFFPIGFVFGASDEEMEHAKTLGANSLHMEYSLSTLFPDSPDMISPKGLEEMKGLHDRAARHNLTLFPLLTGHYIPQWLRERAGDPPVDATGNKIGLWFEYSIHNPVFLNALERFWKTVAGEVGEDPNVGAFVNWNEPGYGLDMTPDAVKAYQSYLVGHYPDITAMNKEFNTKFESFDKIIPPSKPDDNRQFWYAWVTYNQQAFADFFARERQIIQSIAPNAKVTSKHPVMALTGDALFCNDPVLQSAAQDFYGCDGYNGSIFHYRNIMEVARSLNKQGPVITFETRQQKGLGQSKPASSALQLFAQIIGGCRGMFYFCFGNEPSFGFETDSATPPDVRKAITKLFCSIRDNQAVYAAPRKQAEIAVLLSNPSTIHYGTVAEPSMRDEYTKRVNQTYDMLRNQHFAVDFISDRQFNDKLMSYKLLIIPSLSILSAQNISQVIKFHASGGKIVAFGKSLEKDEWFEPIPVPAFLGLKSRGPSPWNRGQMRIVEVVPELFSAYHTEITVQSPEIVDALPMEQLIPGYIPKTKIVTTALAANQDAYPSIIQSSDGQVVYCAFDSIYSEGLSNLLAGIVQKVLKINREISVISDGNEDPAVLTAINESRNQKVLLIANNSPNPGKWKCKLEIPFNGKLMDITGDKSITVRNGIFELKLAGYGYGVYTF